MTRAPNHFLASKQNSSIVTLLTPLVAGALLVLSSSALVLGTASCKKERPVKKKRARLVKVHQVTGAGGPTTRTFSGVSEASLESNLSFKVAGSLTKIEVQAGDKVKRRALIAQLDTTDYERKLKQAQASGAGSNSSSQAVKLARQQLDDTRLAAPIDGAIAAVLVEVNENVKAGQPIVQLASGARPKVTAAVPASLIARVKRGEDVEVTFESLPDQSLAAVISEIAIGSNSTEAVFPVTVILVEANDAIRPGMAADVTFRFEAKKEADREYFVVPPSAVGQDRVGRFVYILESDADGQGVVRRQAVEVGDELRRDGIQVFEGVKDGDFVVTAGLSKMKDGMTVRVPPGVRPPARTSAAAVDGRDGGAGPGDGPGSASDGEIVLEPIDGEQAAGGAEDGVAAEADDGQSGKKKRKKKRRPRRKKGR